MFFEFITAKDMLRSGSRMLAPIAQAGGFSLEDFTPRKSPKYVCIYYHTLENTCNCILYEKGQTISQFALFLFGSIINVL